MTLYSQSEKGDWVIWPAHLYNQFNPQYSAKNGNYVFIAPRGTYYLQVEKEGYKTFRSKPFVSDNIIVNEQIKLAKSVNYINILLRISIGILAVLIFIYIVKRKKKTGEL